MGVVKLRRIRWTIPPALVLLGVSLSSGPSLQLRGRTSSSAQESPFSSSAGWHLKDWAGKGAQSKPDSLHDKDLDPNSHAIKQWIEELGQVWDNVGKKVEGVKMSVSSSTEWSGWGDNIKHFITPDWARFLPGTLQKLQRELSMAPGSLADEIWKEAQDEEINPEIIRDARVRVGNSLCAEEMAFRQKRQKFVVKALASYLDLREDEICPEDVPVIAVCGSGGGLRALVAGTGSYLAAQESGLWDCVTYTAGVSGSCWLQTLYHSSLIGRDFNRLVGHLKNRLGVHIAFPPKALNLLTTAPTNKYLLSGIVEKLKADPGADFGLVDIYGLLLGARLLVPRGELEVSDFDLKLSNQRYNLVDGEQPLPIYTAVRHEIPVLDDKLKRQPTPETLMQQAEKEAWFQWFEFTPYEFFCEELSAGIPMWAVGRHFNEGKNVVRPGEYPIPELRIPGLMGIWGSAFCATLAHYYKEIRPILTGLTGFGGIDSLIEGKNKDLVRVHPIDPAAIPNYVMGMKDQLPASCPESIFRNDHLRLMDAGMSNNLPIYPLIRPDRDVDVIVAFDASADIKRENWLSVVDGYARQRGIKGWPLGAGWPKEDTELEETERVLRETEDLSKEALDGKIAAQQQDRQSPESSTRPKSKQESSMREEQASVSDTDLTYCNVWIGKLEERVSEGEPPPSKRLFHPSNTNHSDSDFHLMRPDAGIALIYFPFLPNPSAQDLPRDSSQSKQQFPAQSAKNPSKDSTDATQPLAPRPSSINPDVDDFLSTWNFIYTPEQVDSVIGLAKANYAEGQDQVKRVVRAVYERKKTDRLNREKRALEEKRKQEQLQSRKRMEGFIPL
ncbi:hypothetical protein ASPZODRAFT_132034 [Penicilliopsis zonata CBS 506.65]|uniref:Lysophospholipase n=1 Tax=Penicilliopsis zonata CBS 506.65 TaxID=1073090 RepID=A0A1L9SIQ4_9EURO|nr:hypothetical protein ASPZODRAFT_132034 [Penicilliopsis zonata CBS 506.65]OJJ47095.1 hypothetical protein ASPZODRAFT_132034 [Penicilliopsis zonata CBS 506.65]